jgi:transposase
MYGPRTQAIAALCTGAYRLSKRVTQQVLDDLFGLPMSLGTLSTLEGATTEAVAAPVAEARTYVQQQACAHLDETGWREGRQRAWLWVAATMWVTVFVVRLSRGGQVARDLLGEAFWHPGDGPVGTGGIQCGGVNCVGRICCGTSKR